MERHILRWMALGSVVCCLLSCGGTNTGNKNVAAQENEHVLIPICNRETCVYLDNKGTIMKPEVNAVETSAFYGEYAVVGVNKGREVLYGFINRSGKLVIPTEYIKASILSEGLAWVRRDRQSPIVAIDESGKEVLQLPGNIVTVRRFCDGLAAVQFDSHKWGYIDKTGKVVIEPKYWNVSDFSCGLAIVKSESPMYGFINLKGEVVIPEQFYDDNSGLVSKNFSPEGYAVVGVGQTMNRARWGIINTKGEYALPLTDEYSYILPDGDGFVAYKKETGFGYIKADGSVILPFSYLNLNPFHNGKYSLAVPISGEKKYAIIDRKGNVTANTQFNNVVVKSFRDGMAVLNNGYRAGDGSTVINDRGEPIYVLKYPEEVAADYCSPGSYFRIYLH